MCGFSMTNNIENIYSTLAFKNEKKNLIDTSHHENWLFKCQINASKKTGFFGFILRIMLKIANLIYDLLYFPDYRSMWIIVLIDIFSIEL